MRGLPADGTFVSAGLPPGDYTITVRVTGAPPGRGALDPSGVCSLWHRPR